MNGTMAAQRQVHGRRPRTATIGATTLGHRAHLLPTRPETAGQGTGGVTPSGLPAATEGIGRACACIATQFFGIRASFGLLTAATAD